VVERQFQVVERQTEVTERRSGPFRLNLTTGAVYNRPNDAVRGAKRLQYPALSRSMQHSRET